MKKEYWLRSKIERTPSGCETNHRSKRKWFVVVVVVVLQEDWSQPPKTKQKNKKTGQSKSPFHSKQFYSGQSNGAKILLS